MKKNTRFQTKYKIDRRTGKNVLGRAKSPVIKRQNRPGLKPGSMPVVSHYGKCLIQKQMTKLIFCVFKDNKFKNIIKEAKRIVAASKESASLLQELVQLLELRLITVVYRCLFAATPHAARQLVSHKKVLVNGKVQNVGSMKVKIGDVIELTEACANNEHVKKATLTKERMVPDFLKVEGSKCTIIGTPSLKAPYIKDIDLAMAIESTRRG